MQDLTLLRLQQISDSAVPIGGAAHSFGLESLVDAGLVHVDNLQQFLADYLEETGAVEAWYCMRSACVAESAGLIEWLAWNTELGARKMPRESREGSAAMGRRFLHLAVQVSNMDLLSEALTLASETSTELHLAACFGLVAGAFGVEARLAALAYLQQSTTGLVGASQRLLPLGQTHAQKIHWALKPAILAAVARGATAESSRVGSFTPLVDIASARHPALRTRLFIS